MINFSLFHPKAKDEFIDRVIYQKKNFPELAQDWVLEVEKTINKLQENPFVYQEREFGHSIAKIGKFPHYLAYIVRDDKLWFVAFGSSSQDYLYWKDRLGNK